MRPGRLTRGMAVMSKSTVHTPIVVYPDHWCLQTIQAYRKLITLHGLLTKNNNNLSSIGPLPWKQMYFYVTLKLKIGIKKSDYFFSKVRLNGYFCS